MELLLINSLSKVNDRSIYIGKKLIKKPALDKMLTLWGRFYYQSTATRKPI